MGCLFLLQGIFPTQRWKLCLLWLLHWQVDPLTRGHLGITLQPSSNLVQHPSSLTQRKNKMSTNHGLSQLHFFVSISALLVLSSKVSQAVRGFPCLRLISRESPSPSISLTCQQSFSISLYSVFFLSFQKPFKLLLFSKNSPSSYFHLPLSCLSHYEVNVTPSCPTFYDSMDCSLPGSSVRGILQERLLE